MILAVALLNILLGVAYTSYGVIAALEMKNDWRSFGFSHFGAAWIAMAFTAAPTISTTASTSWPTGGPGRWTSSPSSSASPPA